MSGVMRHYEAVGAKDGRLTSLGSAQEILARAWGETRDLWGGTVLPGLTDSHVHLLHHAIIQENLSLFDMASTGKIIEWGWARIERNRPSYLTGMGWNQETMVEGRLVTREDLDHISAGIPMYMLQAYLYIGACNFIMLECIRALKDVAPEVLTLVDFSNGILREDATRLYMEVLLRVDDAYVKELTRLGQRDLNAVGITCVNSNDLKAITGADPIRLIDIFREMEADGELTVRIHEQYLVEPEDSERFQAVHSNPADRESLFRTGPRKLLQDGSLEAKPAEMTDGYLDEPDNHGIPIYTEEELCSRIRAAHTAHMDVAVYVIGDLTFRKMCGVIERVEQGEPWPDHRHGIVRAQTTIPALLEWMKALGLQAYIQPIFIDVDMNIIVERVGEAHVKECYNQKATEDLDIRVSGGSNCPAEPFSVLDNLRIAVTRWNQTGTRIYLPEQVLTVGQTVWLFTSDVAWVGRDGTVRSTLELGKQADLVVLSQDLFKIPHQDFNRVKVLEVVLNGVTVYRAETLQSAHSLDYGQQSSGEEAL